MGTVARSQWWHWCERKAWLWGATLTPVGGSYVEANQLIHKLVAAVQRNNNTHKNLIAEAVAALFQVNSQKVYRRDWRSSDLH
jgi:hypothetical protein